MTVVQDDASRPWERENDPRAVRGVVGLAMALAVLCAGVGFAARLLDWRWGFTVAVYGEPVLVSWTQLMWLGVPLVFAGGIRSRGGGIAATVAVALAGVLAVLAAVAFQGGSPLLPTDL